MASTASKDSFTFTVGKLDAGMAILLGERAHLIEFPSILLPPGATTGSIVNIAVHQNHAEEKKRDSEFWNLQEDILSEFGSHSPEAPELKVRNITQTSVTLEWAPLKLATAKLRSLDIYRNGERLSSIPSPLTNTSTKHSGMELNTEYTFQLIMRTTAGTYPSNLLRMRTHTMHDTSGISVCFGTVQDPALLNEAKQALTEMGAKWSDKIQIDTSHFVCTTAAATPAGASTAGNLANAPGVMYQRALQLSIPIVQPHWVLACRAEKRMVPIAQFYLGANPSPSTVSFQRPQSMSQASLSQAVGTPPVSGGGRNPAASQRASMPPPARSPPASATPPSQASAFVNQPSPSAEAVRPKSFIPPVEESAEDEADTQTVRLDRTPTAAPTAIPATKTSIESKRKSRGSMNREFKFPPATPPIPPTEEFVGGGATSPPMSPPTSPPFNVQQHLRKASDEPEHVLVVHPSSIEVPAPPPVEKELNMSRASLADSDDEDVGDTEDIPL